MRQLTMRMLVFGCFVLGCAVACSDDEGHGNGSIDMMAYTPPAPVETPVMYQEVPGLDPYPMPPLNEFMKDEPPVTLCTIWDRDGDGQEEVMCEFNSFVASAGMAIRKIRWFRFAGGRLQRDETWPENDPFVAAPDLDGDGVPDRMTSFTSQIGWGSKTGGGVAYTYKDIVLVPQRGYVGPYFNLYDFDGNGLTDIAMANGCEGDGLFNILSQKAPREFEVLREGGPATVATYAFLLMPFTSGKGVVFGAIGPNCQMDRYKQVPILYHRQALGGIEAISPYLPSFSNAPMGGTMADFDEDGEDEIVVTLHPDITMMHKGKEVFASFRYAHSDKGKLMIPWPAAAVDLDLDGRTDLLVAYGADAKYSEEVIGIGPEHTIGFRNTGDPMLQVFGKFQSLGDMDKRGDWRTMSLGDLNHDGKPDVALGGFGDQPHVYLSQAPGNGVSLRFLGARGQTPYGSLVKIHTSQGTRQRRVGSNIGSPFTVSEPLLFLGLGPDASCTVEVAWPSGKTTMHPVQAGTLTTIREPN